MKLVSSLLAVLLSLLLLSPAVAQAASPAKITFFHYFSGALSGGVEEMVASVNRDRTDAQVLAQGLDHEAFKTMIRGLVARGNPPEMFSYWAGAKTQQLVDEGHLLPLDDLWRGPGLADGFATAVADRASLYNGRRYLLPITQHFVVFFYNARLFARHGLTAPATWEELLHLAATFKEQGVKPFALGAKERWPAQFWFDYLLLRLAGPDYRQRLMAGEASYGDPEVERAYALWGELLSKGFFNEDVNDADWSEAIHHVCSGKAAMTLMGTWAMPLLSSATCGLEEESGFDFFPFPVMDPALPKVALGPVDGIVLSTAAAQHPLAMTLLGYFAEAEPQLRFSLGSGAFAANSRVPVDSYSPLKRRIQKEMAAAEEWAFNYDLATRPAVAEKGLDSFTELLAFPGQYREILRHLSQETDALRHHP